MKHRYVVRYAYADHYPPGTDLRDAVWEDLWRYARHFSLTFDRDDVWIMSGERWRRQRPGEFHTELMIPGHVPTGVVGARACVDMIEAPSQATAGSSRRRRRHPVPTRQDTAPCARGRTHWNEALNGTSRRERRKLRRRRRRLRRRRSRDRLLRIREASLADETTAGPA